MHDDLFTVYTLLVLLIGFWLGYVVRLVVERHAA
jgi:hypothetical protein